MPGRLGLDKDTWNRKHYNFGERNLFRLDLNESREGFYRTGRGRTFYIDGLKIEKAQEPTVESGARNLEAESIRSGVESTGGHKKLKTVSSHFQTCSRSEYDGVHLATVRKTTRQYQYTMQSEIKSFSAGNAWGC